MSPAELFRATAFRIALTFSAVIAVVTGGVFAIIYNEVANADLARLKAVIVDEARAAAAGDDTRLERALALRLTHDYRRMDYVGLYDAAGALKFGNLKSRPDIPADGEAHLATSFDAGEPTEDAAPVLFVGMRRADGGAVVLGRSLIELFALRKAVAIALEAAILPTALAALAAGVFFSRRISAHLTMINKSIAAIIEGDLRTRLPVSGGADELEQISRAVNGMLDEIERLLDQLANVGDNIAHDIRSPISFVRAKLEMASREPALPPGAAAGIQTALEQLDRVTATITALLRVSVMEGGRRHSSFVPMDLSDICRDAFELYAPMALEKGVRMKLRAPEPAPAKGDIGLMREAIANIVENAVKYTPPGGDIEISCTSGDDGPAIIVSDTGVGVPRDDRQRIFTRFYRARGAETEPGSGIGLSIATMIAKLHGFNLHVEDNDPGARFVMKKGAKGALGL